MRKYLIVLAIVGTLIFVANTTSFGLAYHVLTDISWLMGSPFELEFDLYNNNYYIGGVSDPSRLGDSYVRIDNVFIKDAYGIITPPGLLDYDDGSLEGFVDLNSPGTVNIVPGASPYDPGNLQLEMGEDPVYYPSIIYRDFSASSATFLGFDFELCGSDIPGDYGLDNFVCSLLDPYTLDPLMGGITGGGDFLDVSSGGITAAVGAVVTPIPEPSTFLLLGSGLLGLAAYNRVRRRRSK